jgi:hypothetical protein
MRPKTAEESHAADRDRIAFLIGHKVRVTWTNAEGSAGEPFDATLTDVLPLGNSYFFRFEMPTGMERLTKLASVTDLQRLPK